MYNLSEHGPGLKHGARWTLLAIICLIGLFGLAAWKPYIGFPIILFLMILPLIIEAILES